MVVVVVVAWVAEVVLCVVRGWRAIICMAVVVAHAIARGLGRHRQMGVVAAGSRPSRRRVGWCRSVPEADGGTQKVVVDVG